MSQRTGAIIHVQSSRYSHTSLHNGTAQFFASVGVLDFRLDNYANPFDPQFGIILAESNESAGNDARGLPNRVLDVLRMVAAPACYDDNVLLPSYNVVLALPLESEIPLQYQASRRTALVSFGLFR